MAKEGYMTGDQLIKYLHISKRKLKYLMENNYIPHQDSGQKTHKYFVRIEDAEEFDKRQHTDVKLKNELKGLFTSKTEHHPVPLIVITDDICDKFKVFLNDFFKEEQEALTVSRICQLTNFNAETIYRLIAEGTLYGTKARGKMYCSKSDLIDYLSSESTLRNPTCEGYRSLVRAFKRKRSDDTYNEQRRERRRIEREKKGSDT